MKYPPPIGFNEIKIKIEKGDVSIDEKDPEFLCRLHEKHLEHKIYAIIFSVAIVVFIITFLIIVFHASGGGNTEALMFRRWM